MANKKKSGKKAKKGQKPAVVKVKAPTAAGHMSLDPLSKCAKEYGSLQAWPYVRNHAACVPTMPAFPSLKQTFYINATAYANNDGLVWAVVNPGHGAVNVTNSALWTSKAGANRAYIDLTTSYSLPNYTNSPYAAMSSTTLQYRVVAAGVRCMYVGEVKDTAGVITLVETPDHATIDQHTRADLAAFDESATYGVQPGTWYHVEWHPADPEELQYVASSTGVYSQPCFGFCIDGVPAGAAFLVEAYYHYEFVGTLARGRTPSHSDSAGLSAAIGVNASPAGRKPGALTGRSDATKAVATKVADRLRAMAQYAIHGLTGAARSLGKLDVGPLLKHAEGYARQFANASLQTVMASAPLLLAL